MPKGIVGEWTTEKPKTQGYYWIRQKKYPEPIIAEFLPLNNSVQPYGFKGRSADEVTHWAEIPEPAEPRSKHGPS